MRGSAPPTAPDRPVLPAASLDGSPLRLPRPDGPPPAWIDQGRLEASRRLCARLTRAEAGNFRLAFRVLPAPRRRAMHALYAFCRLADDLADEPMPEDRREAGFRTLEEGLDALGGPVVPGSGIWPALGETVRRHGLPRDELATVIEGCRLDRVRTRYETFADLRDYCWKVAGVIGALTLRIFGLDPDALPVFCRDGGTAVQMTNILRDVEEDAGRGRIYLPLEDLERFGVQEWEVLSGRMTPAFRELMRFEVERVKSLYRAAARAIPPAERAGAAPLEIIQGIYRRVLDDLVARDHDPFAGRARIPGWRKASVALGFLVRRAAGWPPRDPLRDGGTA